MDNTDGRGCINIGGIRGKVVIKAVAEAVAKAVAAIVWFIDTGRSTKYY